MGIFSRREDYDWGGSGHWAISSKSDPRWDASGSCAAGMWSSMAACEKAVEAKRKTLGEPPDDLEYGGGKS